MINLQSINNRGLSDLFQKVIKVSERADELGNLRVGYLTLVHAGKQIWAATFDGELPEEWYERSSEPDYGIDATLTGARATDPLTAIKKAIERANAYLDVNEE